MALDQLYRQGHLQMSRLCLIITRSRRAQKFYRLRSWTYVACMMLSAVFAFAAPALASELPLLTTVAPMQIDVRTWPSSAILHTSLLPRGPGIDQLHDKPPRCPAGSVWHSRPCRDQAVYPGGFADHCHEAVYSDEDGTQTVVVHEVIGQCSNDLLCESYPFEADGVPRIICRDPPADSGDRAGYLNDDDERDNSNGSVDDTDPTDRRAAWKKAVSDMHRSGLKQPRLPSARPGYRFGWGHKAVWHSRDGA